MTVFNMITNADPAVTNNGNEIYKKYFTIDTADLQTVQAWLDYNPMIRTYAEHDGIIQGYFNIMPITSECAALFDRQVLKEEDMTIEHLLPIQAVPQAQYVYLAAIAVRDYTTCFGRQCVAALLGTIASQFLRGYSPARLTTLYANPTTFKGNLMVRKLGLKPVAIFKKILKDNDIYTIDFTPDLFDHLNKIENRYSRFIGDNPWGKIEE